ncbi:MAG: right-handed parallel beta-helix repeat-containing protein [Clostridia bacterium]|nr:right-handed parallel beta-helix repeat-containing protein [Clostridia bacterium]
MFNPKDFGAMGDGIALDSKAIQKAIDACFEAGGGTVYIPEGKYLCGTMHLKTNVHIWLDKGATILGSKNREDFDRYEEDAANTEFQDRSHSFFHHSLFHADGANDIALTGFGKIDMQSAWEDLDFTEFPGSKGCHWCRGCKVVAFKECTNVVIRDLVIRNATDLAVYVAGCENVTISGLNLFSHVDGISPDSCKNVVISDCIVDTGDDAIVPKCSYTLGRFKSMENLTVANCVVRSTASAIKFGTESNSAFINTTITGCTVYDTRLEGLFIMTADGARVEGLSISNITMRNVAVPIALLVSNRARGPEGTAIGEMKNISISNVIVTGPYTETIHATMAQNSKDYYANTLEKPCHHFPLLIAGQEDSVIKNVSLSNIQFVVPGGGSEADREIVLNELRTQYPSVRAFGTKAPVYGFYAKHVDNLKLYNVDFITEKPDARDAMQLEHVTRFKQV